MLDDIKIDGTLIGGGEMADHICIAEIAKKMLKAYPDMSWKLDQLQTAGIISITEIDEKLSSIPSGVREPIGGGDRESFIVALLDRKDSIQSGLDDVIAYHKRFRPPWDKLTDAEKYILTESYMNNEDRLGYRRIMARYNVSKSEASRRRSAAFVRFANSLEWWIGVCE